MSPVVCKLLALAALFATAQSICTKSNVGTKTLTPVPFQALNFNAPGIEVLIDTNYCPYSMHVVGEEIVACNNVATGNPPNIVGPARGLLSPFNVLCNFIECPRGGTVDVTQYCDY